MKSEEIIKAIFGREMMRFILKTSVNNMPALLSLFMVRAQGLE